MEITNKYSGIPWNMYNKSHYQLLPPGLKKILGETLNRDVHFWQKYYSILAEKYSHNIRKLVNQEPPTHARTSDTRKQWHRVGAFMICMKSICLFQQLRHQHSTSNLFQRGLWQIDLHVPKTDRYLFIYFTEHSLHDGELGASKTKNTRCVFLQFICYQHS